MRKRRSSPGCSRLRHIMDDVAVARVAVSVVGADAEVVVVGAGGVVIGVVGGVGVDLGPGAAIVATLDTETGLVRSVVGPLELGVGGVPDLRGGQAGRGGGELGERRGASGVAVIAVA